MNDEDHHWLKQGSTSSGEVREVYDEWAENYDETLHGWNYRAPAEAAAMLRADIAADAAILDAGCGTGLTGVALRDAGFSGPIDGIDVSPASLREAQKHGVYRTLTEMDLQALPLPIRDNAYDAVLCVGVLTYVPDSEAILREFVRVVRPGGHVLITQRDDLFEARGDRDALDRLADVVGPVTISEPRLYLPDNPDFADRIKVIYVNLTVAKTD